MASSHDILKFHSRIMANRASLFATPRQRLGSCNTVVAQTCFRLVNNYWRMIPMLLVNSSRRAASQLVAINLELIEFVATSLAQR